MKVISIAFALILGFGFTSVAQEGAYTEAMQTNIKAMKDASGTQDYQAVANTFSRISEMNSSEWLPAYYTGFVYVIMSFQSGLTDDERDAYLDIAGKYADQAAGTSQSACSKTLSPCKTPVRSQWYLNSFQLNWRRKSPKRL